MKKLFYISLTACCLMFNTNAALAKENIEFNTQDFMPYSYKDDGRLKGAVSELVEKVCEKMDHPCTYNFHAMWGKAVRSVKDGESDALFVVGKNKDREEWLNFSLPVLNAEYGFFTWKNDNKYTSLKDLAGKKVGVYGPSNTSHSLSLINDELKAQNLPEMNIKWNYTTANVVEDMLRGKVDMMYSNKAVGESFNELLPENLKMNYLGKHKDLKYFIAFSKKTVSESFVTEFNDALVKLDNRGVLNRIFGKYKLPYSPLGTL